MKKTRIIASILALVSVSGVMSGCGNNAEITDADVTTISIWHGNTHSQKYFEEKVANYNETTGKEKGIKIDFTVKTDLNKNIELALANESAPDIILELGNVQKAAELGQIVALDDIPGGQEIIEKYKDYIIPNDFDDKTYRIPYYPNTRGIIYNKDMFKAAGIVDENGEPTPPETFDEVVEYAKKLTNPDKGEYGIAIPAKWGNWMNLDWFALMMNTAGSVKGYDPETGKYDYTALKPIAEMYMQIKADESYFPGAEGLDNDPARARFAEGVVGMKFSSSYDVAVLTDQFPAKCDWGVAPLPFVDKNKKYMQDSAVINYACINAKSVEEKGAEKILEVYKWFISDEVVQDVYKKGYFLPIRYESIEGVTELEAPKQWEEFAAMVPISVHTPQMMPVEWGEDIRATDVVRDYIWSGRWTIDEAIEYMNEKANAAVERYKSSHPDMDASKYIQENFDISRKD
ncbi:MAG: carbohydrate ABC transporter substrate-binding protein [Clostridia bacterium]|nr:carbohydrate ABC transporter substrate-binding protein [Clostridia bacterium]